MADEAQLFGYQSLSAGSHWYFGISFDDDLPQQIIEDVTYALTGTVRVGRSRSAEYGLFLIKNLTMRTWPSPHAKDSTCNSTACPI